MLYVGLTEDHKESATMFANMVGVQVLSMLEALSSRIEQAANNRTGKHCSLNPKPFKSAHVMSISLYIHLLIFTYAFYPHSYLNTPMPVCTMCK